MANSGLIQNYLDLKRQKLAALQARKRELEDRASEAARARAEHWMANPRDWVRDVVRFPSLKPESSFSSRASRVGQPSVAGLAPYQGDSLDILAENGRLLVFGPHGLGKSTSMALAHWWFATTRELARVDWKAITTASSWKQLNDFLWPEIHKWAKFINWELLGMREPQLGRDLLGLGLKWEWGASSAAASTDPAKMEGAHASHLMYILDEAKAIQSGTWDAIEGAFSTADDEAEEGAGVDPATGERVRPIRNILAVAMSTPGPASGRFYSIATGKPGFEDWKVRKVAQAEVIQAGRMSRKWAEQRRLQWGAGSSVYRMRVLGEFFLDDPEALVPLSWIEAAQARWEAWKAAGRPELEGPRWLGVDVAGGGADRTVLARRTGYCITRLNYPIKTDLMDVAKEVAAIRRFRPVVDTLGIGQGVTSRLREMFEEGTAAHRPLPFVGSASTGLRNLTGEYGFVNQRSAAWWQVREALDPQNGREAMLPPDPELVADLCAPTWSIAESGSPPKIRVEPKDRVKLKLGRSPDFGDAVAMAYWAGANNREVLVAKRAALGAQAKDFDGASTMGPVADGPGGPGGRGGDPRGRGGARGAAPGRLGGPGQRLSSPLGPLGRGSTAKRTKGGL